MLLQQCHVSLELRTYPIRLEFSQAKGPNIFTRIRVKDLHRQQDSHKNTFCESHWQGDQRLVWTLK